MKMKVFNEYENHFFLSNSTASSNKWAFLHNFTVFSDSVSIWRIKNKQYNYSYSCFIHNTWWEIRGNESFVRLVKGGEKEFIIATGCACFLVHAWPRLHLLCEKLLYFSTTIHRFAAHVFGSHKNHSRCSSSVVIHLISHIPYSS